MGDAKAKGRIRAPAGEAHLRAKLTALQVEEIRTSAEGATALATRFGVHNSQIYRIRSGKIWRQGTYP